MTVVIQILFLFSLILILNSYVFYPLVIKLLSHLYPKVKEDNFSGRISLIISAFNEENIIKERIENIANQSLEFDKFELLIGSDGSADNTVTNFNGTLERI